MHYQHAIIPLFEILQSSLEYLGNDLLGSTRWVHLVEENALAWVLAYLGV